MATTALPSARNPSVAAAGAAIFGAYSLALGLLMAIAPRTFFDKIGPFGPANVHYVRDTATWYLAAGLALLVAVRRPSWRVPIFALLLAQDVLHVINHLIDVWQAHPRWVGVFDAVSLTVLGGVFAWLLLVARREEAPR
jgi:uncharacterized membrane protein